MLFENLFLKTEVLTSNTKVAGFRLFQNHAELTPICDIINGNIKLSFTFFCKENKSYVKHEYFLVNQTEHIQH